MAKEIILYNSKEEVNEDLVNGAMNTKEFKEEFFI